MSLVWPCSRPLPAPPPADGAVKYVDHAAPGPTHDGSSWNNAFTTITAGLNAAGTGDEVWVAQGTYTVGSLTPDHPVFVDYSDVEGGVPSGSWQGSDNINVDPDFVNSGSGDFRLDTGSPCIDDGSNALLLTPHKALDLERHPRIVVATIDMGCFEFSDCSCLGDANGDGFTNLADLNIVLFYSDTEQDACTNGDVTGDGEVDLEDLNYVLFYFGQCCNGCSCEEEEEEFFLQGMPQYLEELGFETAEEYQEFVQTLDSEGRTSHSTELIIYYTIYGE